MKNEVILDTLSAEERALVEPKLRAGLPLEDAITVAKAQIASDTAKAKADADAAAVAAEVDKTGKPAKAK